MQTDGLIWSEQSEFEDAKRMGQYAINMYRASRNTKTVLKNIRLTLDVNIFSALGALD